MTCAILFGIESIKLQQYSGVIFSAQFFWIFSRKSGKDEGDSKDTFCFNCLQQFSIGLRSGLFDGHTKTSMFLLERKFFHFL